MTYTKTSFILFGIALAIFIIMTIYNESAGGGLKAIEFVYVGSILIFLLWLAGIILSIIACFKEKQVLSWVGLSLFLLPVLIILLNMIGIDNFIHKPREKSVPQQLETFSQQIDRNAPVMINDEIRLDGSISVGQEINYSYTFVNRTKDEVNTEELEEIVNNDAKANPHSAFFRKNGIVVHYSFTDKNDSLIGGLKYDFRRE